MKVPKVQIKRDEDGKKKIMITGNRDPRGADNVIRTWIDDDDKLHIEVEKPAMRCYAFEKMIDRLGSVEIIQG